MRTHWCLKFSLNLTNFCIDCANNSTSKNFCLKRKRDKPEFNNYKNKKELKALFRVLSLMKTNPWDPQMPKTKEKST